MLYLYYRQKQGNFKMLSLMSQLHINKQWSLIPSRPLFGGAYCDEVVTALKS